MFFIIAGKFHSGLQSDELLVLNSPRNLQIFNKPGDDYCEKYLNTKEVISSSNKFKKFKYTYSIIVKLIKLKF